MSLYEENRTLLWKIKNRDAKITELNEELKRYKMALELAVNDCYAYHCPDEADEECEDRGYGGSYCKQCHAYCFLKKAEQSKNKPTNQS